MTTTENAGFRSRLANMDDNALENIMNNKACRSIFNAYGIEILKNLPRMTDE
jgi:hypothetical protein